MASPANPYFEMAKLAQRVQSAALTCMVDRTSASNQAHLELAVGALLGALRSHIADGVLSTMVAKYARDTVGHKE